MTAPFPPGPAAERLLALARAAAPDDAAGWAVRQGIGPLLADQGCPEPALAESRRHAGIVWLALGVHLERVVSALHAAGIPVLALKGAALAASHYAHPAHRPMGDLDLLVPSARWTAALAAIEALGFAMDDPAEHGAGLAGPGGVRVELHASLTTCPAVFDVRFDDLHARSAPLPGVPHGRRLGDEDLLLHAALHTAFQHGFRVRLSHYVDVSRLLASGLQWDIVEHAGGRARALRSLAALCAATETLLGVAPPEGVRDRLARLVPRTIGAWIAARAGRPWELLDGLPLARARWSLVEGPICRARLLTGTLWPGRPDGSREVSPWKALRRGRRLIRHLR